MEAALGHDLGTVRIHAGAAAASSAQELNAEAYTVGRDIVFGAGRYPPRSKSSRTLLAHELFHTLQQTRPAFQSRISRADPTVESQAQEAAVRAMDGRAVPAPRTARVALALAPPRAANIEDSEGTLAGDPLEEDIRVAESELLGDLQTHSGTDKARQVMEAIEILRELRGAPTRAREPRYVPSRWRDSKRRVKDWERYGRELTERRDEIGASVATGTGVLFAAGATGGLAAELALAARLGYIGIAATTGGAEEFVRAGGLELLRQYEAPSEEIDLEQAADIAVQQGTIGALTGAALVSLLRVAKRLDPALPPTYRAGRRPGPRARARAGGHRHVRTQPSPTASTPESSGGSAAATGARRSSPSGSEGVSIQQALKQGRDPGGRFLPHPRVTTALKPKQGSTGKSGTGARLDPPDKTPQPTPARSPRAERLRETTERGKAEENLRKAELGAKTLQNLPTFEGTRVARGQGILWSLKTVKGRDPLAIARRRITQFRLALNDFYTLRRVIRIANKRHKGALHFELPEELVGNPAVKLELEIRFVGKRPTSAKKIEADLQSRFKEEMNFVDGDTSNVQLRVTWTEH